MNKVMMTNMINGEKMREDEDDERGVAAHCRVVGIQECEKRKRKRTSSNNN